MVISMPLKHSYNCPCSETANREWASINLSCLYQQQQRFSRFPYMPAPQWPIVVCATLPSHLQPPSLLIVKVCLSISVWEFTGLRNFGLDICDLARCTFDTNPLTNLHIKMKLNKRNLLHTTVYYCAAFLLLWKQHPYHLQFIHWNNSYQLPTYYS